MAVIYSAANHKSVGWQFCLFWVRLWPDQVLSVAWFGKGSLFSTCFLPLGLILIKKLQFYAFFTFQALQRCLYQKTVCCFPLKSNKICRNISHSALHSGLLSLPEDQSYFPYLWITSEFNSLQAQARYNLISRVLEFLRTAPTNTQAYTMGLRNVSRHMIGDIRWVLKTISWREM